jgi:hypothetical protein
MQEMSEQEKEIKRKKTLLTESEKQAIVNCCLERREITPGILNKQLYKFAANIFFGKILLTCLHKFGNVIIYRSVKRRYTRF